MRSFPALDIRFIPEAENAADLHDRLVAGLDDFHPSAIDDSVVGSGLQAGTQAKLWRVFFDTRDSRELALAWLRTHADPRIAVAPVDVQDEDWARRSQAELRPVRAGRFVITPPWARDAAREGTTRDDEVIVIVPSTGFGTGHHASTRLCLELLQEVGVGGRSVLDVGTGSGVLAIAAARLGARSVVAIDNDPDAIAAATENIGLNGVIVRLACAPFPDVGSAFRRIPGAGETGSHEHDAADVLVANLTGQMLRRIATDVVWHTAPGGDIIVSGVLADEQPDVVDAFKSAGASLATRKAADEWVGLHFRR